MIVIEFPENHSSNPRTTHAHILNVIGSSGKNLLWRVFDIDGHRTAKSALNYLELEQESEKESGILMSWDELNQFADEMGQFYWCCILGGTSFVIECQDSSCWVVGTNESEIAEQLLAQFPQAEVGTSANFYWPRSKAVVEASDQSP